MQRTPLIAQHQSAGAKLVDFAGWEMPIQYSGVVDEYQTVRTKVGLFDVSHMGRFWLSGADTLAFLQRVTTNDVRKLAVSHAQYSTVCNEQGGIKDDIFIYRIASEDFLLCVNASNREKILSWLKSHLAAPQAVILEDRSMRLSQIAIQGPQSRELLASLGGTALTALKLHQVCHSNLGGFPCLLARTGYTGELGYEIYIDTDKVGRLWDLLMQKGSAWGLKPAGLGARDLLRLEMGYLLYGNDINEETTPLEANVEWTVSFQKGDFIGNQALLIQKQTGVARRFMAFELVERAVPRHGFKILDAVSARIIGEVTSGNFSPLLQKGIGVGYVPPSYAIPGTSLTIDIRGKATPAVVVKGPFYKKPRANSV
ncbi:MAG TPA: glycine cleavage system aminomethyltransferase GcvT [Nitrospiraceae bacterium]|nr:glycine cleavage system aminomethyltransferase GcvT [Nitrospiraceae bacterium]